MKNIYLIASYISAFTLGAYVFSTINNIKTPEFYRWFLTILFGIYFFFKSKQTK